MDWFTAHDIGKKGGEARTPAKRKAAKKNGTLGGRPRKSTVGEHIMRRKLSRDEHHAIGEAFFRLTRSERDIFRKFYGLPLGEKRKNRMEPYFDAATVDGIRANKPNKRMSHILKKFRLMARWRLAGGL
jgi:hypothetical protein